MKLIKYIWNRWKKIAAFVGNIQASIIFSILYFLVFVPVGVLLSFSTDFLHIKSNPNWSKMDSNSNGINDLKEQ